MLMGKKLSLLMLMLVFGGENTQLTLSGTTSTNSALSNLSL
jgi:hypothetical protein